MRIRQIILLLVMGWALLCLLDVVAHAAVTSSVSFLFSHDAAGSINEAEFMQVYSWWGLEVGKEGVSAPRVLVIHASNELREVAGNDGKVRVTVQRVSDTSGSHAPPLYVIWIFGDGSGEMFVRALGTVWRDAYGLSEEEVHKHGQRVFDRVNGAFVEARKEGK